jgi:hypothetical protein
VIDLAGKSPEGVFSVDFQTWVAQEVDVETTVEFYVVVVLESRLPLLKIPGSGVSNQLVSGGHASQCRTLNLHRVKIYSS